MATQDQMDINDAATLDEFMKSNAGQRVFREAEEEAIRDWKTGDSPAKRESAHARMLALESLQRQMRRISQRGALAPRNK